jgi:predicted transcriptional regulator
MFLCHFYVWLGFVMKYANSVLKQYKLQVLRYTIYETCKDFPYTITQLAEKLGVAKSSLTCSLEYLEEENYIIKSSHLDKTIGKWVNYYRTSNRPYRHPDLDKMQEEFNLQRSRRDLDTNGPYDHLINANPNLRVIKQENKKLPRAGGVRKEKWRGIGSSFAMFNGA